MSSARLRTLGGSGANVPETKSRASYRTLSVPPFLVDILNRHLASAPACDYVFTTSKGRLLSRSSFRENYWLPAVKSAGLAPLRFHDLRHSHATLLIAAGAHPKSVQARLGHASITTTLNTYGHLFPSLDEHLTDQLERAYRDADGDQTGTTQDFEVVELPGATSESAV
jgi:integrase